MKKNVKKKQKKSSHPKVRKTCRVCGSRNLVTILSLGSQAVSDFVKSEDDLVTAPLHLVLCDPAKGGCGLLQLRHEAVDPNILYRNYWYKSGMNQTMTDALGDITKSIEKLIPLKRGDIVLDIGANDGTLLRSYTAKGIKKVGFEPARNLVKEAEDGNNIILNDYFNHKAFIKKIGNNLKAKVITSIAMFYDLEDPNTFVADIKRTLSDDGLWIIQMAYLPLMLKLNNFDNICHEHVEYYSLFSLEQLLKRHNLEVFDVLENDVNGGSVRAYIRHKGSLLPSSHGGTKRVEDARRDEEKLGLNKLNVYKKFAKWVEKIKKEISSFVNREAKKGKIIHVYGASTKGNTMLQYFGLDYTVIKAAAERNPRKWGLKTVVTMIPIISEEESRAQQPDYYLVLPWHFRKEFLKREKEYMKKGGKMVFPLPKFEIISMNRGKQISSV